MKDYKKLIEKGSDFLTTAQKILESYKKESGNSFTVYPRHNGGRLGGHYHDVNQSELSMLLSNYHEWVKDIIEFIETTNEDKIEISYFKDTDNIPKDLYEVNNESRPELIKDIVGEVRNKNNKLRELYSKSTLRGKEKIILQINTARMELKRKDEDEVKISFRLKDGENKRFKYLVEIAENPKVSGKSLIELANTANLQNLSKEIGKLNKYISTNLDIESDLIVNDNSSGYKIDDKYSVEID